MRKIIMCFAICLALISCETTYQSTTYQVTTYYQIYQIKPISEDIKVYENTMVYEDDNCTIMYDFWGEYGNIGFTIYNKNSEELYLHLDKCFYINNGAAYDYYKYNDMMVERKTICVPSKSIKRIEEAESTTINIVLYQNCDLNYKGFVKVNNSVSFNQYDSPYVFSNKLAYSTGDSEEIHRIKNEFYVSKITNFSSDDITTYVDIFDCVSRERKSISVIKEEGPDKFYIKY